MQNHRLTNFVKNEFPKSKHFDWVIAKVVLIYTTKKDAQIREITSYEIS